MHTLRCLAIVTWLVSSAAGLASADTYYVTADVNTGQPAPVKIWSGGGWVYYSIPFGYSFLYPPPPELGGTPIDVQFTNFLPPVAPDYGMCTHLYDAVNVTGGHLDLSSSNGTALTDITVRALGNVDVTRVDTVASDMTSTAAHVGLYARDIRVRYTGAEASDTGWIDTRAGDATTGGGGHIVLIAKHGDVVVDKGVTAYCPVPLGYEESDTKSGYLFVNASRFVSLPASRYVPEPEFNFKDFNRWPGGVQLNAGGHVNLTGFITNLDPYFNLNGDKTPYHVFPERQFCSRGAVLYEPGHLSRFPNIVYVLPADPYRDLPDEMNGRLIPSNLYDYSRENDIVRIWDVRPADENEIKRNWTPDLVTGKLGAQLVQVDQVNRKMTVQERFASGGHIGAEVATWVDGRFYPLGAEYVSRYFDTIIDYDASAAPEGGSEWTFQFDAQNLTPSYSSLWNWCGFNLEFWNADFTQRLSGLTLEDWSDKSLGDDVPFEHSSYGGGVLSFWSDYYANYHHAGETHSYWVTINLSQINGTAAGEFGIRQIPIIVPEPGMMGLAGVLAALMLGRRRRRV